MSVTPSTLLSLPVIGTGTEPGTWGNYVNNGLTSYLDNAIAGTVTLTNDGAVTLANTAGDNSATNIVSSLTGAGSVSAQFAIIRVTGTLTTAKVLTAPSTSKTYVVVNAATGSTVTIKASGQTGVSVAVGESATVYFNGTDYVKSASTVITNLTGTLAVANGGTGLTSTPANGALDIGNGTGFTRTTLTAGTGITVTNASGAITIAASGTVSAATPTALGTVYAKTNNATAFETFLGYQAGNSSTGVSNTAIGYQAGYSITYGTYNTCLGYQAGYSTTNMSYDVCIGYQAGYILGNNGSDRIAIGNNAGKYIDGIYSIAIGTQALFGSGSTVNNQYNTAIGYRSQYSSTTGDYNNSIGGSSLYSVASGSGNSAFGDNAGYAITTGTNNTAIGISAGGTITTGTNNTLIGFNATASSTTVSNEITLGDANVTAFRIPGISITWNTSTGLNSLGVGTPASGTTGEIRATNNITAYYSDDRLKKRLGSVENALDKVRTLDSFYYEANETAQELGYEPIREVGISAQQVQAVLPEVVVPAPISDKYLTVRYERLVPLLIAAIKELEAKVKVLEAK